MLFKLYFDIKYRYIIMHFKGMNLMTTELEIESHSALLIYAGTNYACIISN